MKLYLGSDHRGFELKQALKVHLSSQNIPFEDLGDTTPTPGDDYPDFATVVAEKVVSDLESKGLLLCGSGVGMDIAANKIAGARCGLALNTEQVKAARADDNVNILAVAADYTSLEQAKDYIDIFLNTEFISSDSHSRRLEKISEEEHAE
jgi:ribose 5-phosphate isomerase B